MGLAKLKTKIGVEEYLAGEETSQVRYEFVDGEVFAMSGASNKHNLISGNLFGNLWSHLRDSDCQVYKENMKLKADKRTFYYPDIFVACDKNPENEYYREEPILIIEVISPSTRQIDRREKLRAYQQMPSVQEYVVVEQEKISVEIHRRQPDGRWITYFFNKNDEAFTLESVDLTLALTEVYRRVAFDV